MESLTRSFGRFVRTNVKGAITSAICALTVVTGACAGRTHIATPAAGETVSWFLKAGPREKAQPIVCASDISSPCVITLSADEKRPVESTLVIGVPSGNGHTFSGQMTLGFMTHDDRPNGLTRDFSMMSDPKDVLLSSTTGLVSRTGQFPMRITLEETGPALQTPRRHNIEVTVTVQ